MKYAIGRRGAFLLLFGIAYLAIGIQVFNPSFPAQFIHETIPMWARLTIWFTSGIAALVAAFLRKPGQDNFGFVALCLPIAWRIVSYIIGIATHIADPEIYPPVLARSVTGIATFLPLLISIMIVASWPDPRREYIAPLLDNEDGGPRE